MIIAINQFDGRLFVMFKQFCTCKFKRLPTKFIIWDSLRFDMHLSMSSGWVNLQTFKGDTNPM